MEWFKAKDNTFGKVEKSAAVNGKTAKCKDKEDFSGQMVSNIKVNLNKIVSTVKECTVGLMGKYTTDNGSKANNTAKEV